MKLKISKVGLTSLHNIPDEGKDHLITKLDISWNNLSSLEGIERYPNLIFLQCMGSGLVSFQGLEGCSEIRKIAAMGNNLKNLHGLENAHQLTHLHVDNNPYLSSLHGIEKCVNLETLDCYACNLVDFSGLEKCPKLHSLSCHSNPLQMTP